MCRNRTAINWCVNQYDGDICIPHSLSDSSKCVHYTYAIVDEIILRAWVNRPVTLCTVQFFRRQKKPHWTWLPRTPRVDYDDPNGTRFAKLFNFRKRQSLQSHNCRQSNDHGCTVYFRARCRNIIYGFYTLGVYTELTLKPRTCGSRKPRNIAVSAFNCRQTKKKFYLSPCIASLTDRCSR